MLGFRQVLLSSHSSAATSLALEACLGVIVAWAGESSVDQTNLAAVILVNSFASVSLSSRGSIKFALCFVNSALVLCGGSAVSHGL